MEQPERGNRKVLDIFLPGMINAYGYRGRFPAVSITGPQCALGCEHCKGYLLKSMYHARTPDKLLRILNNFEKNSMIGALISGGCDKNGRLPWKRFLPYLKNNTFNLYLIAHGGINLSMEDAIGLKKAGIKQILIDVIGDKETLNAIYNISDFGIMEHTLKNAFNSGVDVAPHVVIGLYYGKINGEYSALEKIASYSKKNVILVVFMPDILKVPPPPIKKIIEIFEYANLLFDSVTLGCARPKGQYRRILEEALIEHGLIDRMALFSENAIKKAREHNIKTNFLEGCCCTDLNIKVPVL